MSSTGCSKLNDLEQFPFRICGDKKIIFTGNFREGFHSFGELTCRKIEANDDPENQETVEEGDWVTGVLNGNFYMVAGQYTGSGDIMDKESYTNIQGFEHI